MVSGGVVRPDSSVGSSWSFYAAFFVCRATLAIVLHLARHSLVPSLVQGNCFVAEATAKASYSKFREVHFGSQLADDCVLSSSLASTIFFYCR